MNKSKHVRKPVKDFQRTRRKVGKRLLRDTTNETKPDIRSKKILLRQDDDNITHREEEKYIEEPKQTQQRHYRDTIREEAWKKQKEYCSKNKEYTNIYFSYIIQELGETMLDPIPQVRHSSRNWLYSTIFNIPAQIIEHHQEYQQQYIQLSISHVDKGIRNDGILILWFLTSQYLPYIQDHKLLYMQLSRIQFVQDSLQNYMISLSNKEIDRVKFKDSAEKYIYASYNIDKKLLDINKQKDVDSDSKSTTISNTANNTNNAVDTDNNNAVNAANNNAVNTANNNAINMNDNNTDNAVDTNNNTKLCVDSYIQEQIHTLWDKNTVGYTLVYVLLKSIQYIRGNREKTINIMESNSIPLYKIRYEVQKIKKYITTLVSSSNYIDTTTYEDTDEIVIIQRTQKLQQNLWEYNLDNTMNNTTNKNNNKEKRIQSIDLLKGIYVSQEILLKIPSYDNVVDTITIIKNIYTRVQKLQISNGITSYINDTYIYICNISILQLDNKKIKIDDIKEFIWELIQNLLKIDKNQNQKDIYKQINTQYIKNINDNKWEEEQKKWYLNQQQNKLAQYEKDKIIIKEFSYQIHNICIMLQNINNKTIIIDNTNTIEQKNYIEKILCMKQSSQLYIQYKLNEYDIIKELQRCIYNKAQSISIINSTIESQYKNYQSQIQYNLQQYQDNDIDIKQIDKKPISFIDTCTTITKGLLYIFEQDWDIYEQKDIIYLGLYIFYYLPILSGKLLQKITYKITSSTTNSKYKLELWEIILHIKGRVSLDIYVSLQQTICLNIIDNDIITKVGYEQSILERKRRLGLSNHGTTILIFLQNELKKRQEYLYIGNIQRQLWECTIDDERFTTSLIDQVLSACLWQLSKLLSNNSGNSNDILFDTIKSWLLLEPYRKSLSENVVNLSKIEKNWLIQHDILS